MKLTYNVEDRPKFGQTIVFAIQQLLAILAATIAVPSIIQNGMSQSAPPNAANIDPRNANEIQESSVPW